MGASQPAMATKTDPSDAVKKAIAYIVKNYAGSVSVNQLVGSAEVTRTDLIGGFQQIYGVEPIAWLWMFRTIMAAEILSNAPQFSVEEVTVATGFQDMAYFERCFTNLLGENPRVFRAHCCALHQLEARQRRQSLRFERIEAARAALVGSALEKILSILRPSS